MPHELEEAYKEATAYLTRAKKQRAELEKARGYFKKSDHKGQKDQLKQYKAKLPCSKCGALGHWYKDPECPKFKESFAKKKNKYN